MKEQPGTGGSYIEQEDGTLKLVEQTQPAEERAAELPQETAAPKKTTASAKPKDN
ncbi:MAG: hypothetical protein PGN20_15330 [Agrobacterium cavarae]